MAQEGLNGDLSRTQFGETGHTVKEDTVQRGKRHVAMSTVIEDLSHTFHFKNRNVQTFKDESVNKLSKRTIS